MNTEQILVCGQTGTGKTVRVRSLVMSRPAPRTLVLDRMGEDYPEIPEVKGAREFGETYKELRQRDRWMIRQTAWEIPHHLATLEIVARLKREESRHRPLLVVMEEASFFSSTGDVPDPVSTIITKGRHWGISVVSVAQRTAQVHPQVQDSASTLVFFRTRKPGGWVRQILPAPDGLAQLSPFTSEEYEAGKTPELGVHYVTDPPEADLEERVRKATR